MRVASFKRRTLWLDAADLPWLTEMILGDLSMGGVPDIEDCDKDEAAVADRGEAAVADSPAVPDGSPLCAGKRGWSVAWDFNAGLFGAWTAMGLEPVSPEHLSMQCAAGWPQLRWAARASRGRTR